MTNGETGSAPQVVVLGQIARDLVLAVAAVPPIGQAADVTRRIEVLGGKGANQAVALGQLGVQPVLVGVVGDDDVGRRLLGQAERDGIDVRHVLCRAGVASGLIVEVIDDAGHWRYLQHLPEELLLTVDDVSAARPVLQSAPTVVLQLQQPSAALLLAAQTARDAGRRVILDGAPSDDERRSALLVAADVLRADQHEAELLTGSRVNGAEDAVRAGRQLLDQGPRLVALAAGDNGNVLVWEGGSLVLPFTEQRTRDTTGVGDAFTAALAVALTKGGTAQDAGRLAAAAAASSVTHLGGRPHLDEDEVVVRAGPRQD